MIKQTEAFGFSVKNEDGVSINYQYIKNGKELEVTGYGGGKVLIIPEEVTYMDRTRLVTSIGKRAFASCKDLEKIVIPNNVTTIEEEAFYNCTALTTINIPTSLTSIGKFAFGTGWSIKKVIIKDIEAWCKLEYLGDNPIIRAGIYSDENTEINDLIIPISVSEIRDEAFYECTNLRTVTIPSSVKRIGSYAFYHCENLSSVEIGTDITCAITDEKTKIGMYAFSCCYRLSSISLGNSVCSISGWAFEGCHPTSLILPNSITGIGDHAFDINGLNEIKSYITELFELPERAFNNDTKYNITLKVLEGFADEYRKTKGWKDFLWIEEFTDEGYDGIDSSILNDASFVYYDLTGHQVNKPTNGVFIKSVNNQNGNKIRSKIILK